MLPGEIPGGVPEMVLPEETAASLFSSGDFEALMRVAWIPLAKAIAFIRTHHRHLPKLQGGIVALGLWDSAGCLRGVVVLGRPSRMDSKDMVAITRCCTDGIENGCSKLYAKAKRLGQALGFTSIKTFTLQEESGSSLAAVDATDDGLTEGRSWSRPSRHREDGLIEPRRRWIL